MINVVDKDFIKSPLNYVGGKYKLLPQILPHFPNDINRFVDLFAGGGNVAVNVDANQIYFNDKQTEVVDLISYLYRHDVDFLLSEIDDIIERYSLSKTNREGYLQLRADYNNGKKSPMRFYVLIAYAFNNQIRFNKRGEFNMTFGKDRSSFNPKLRERFIGFVEELHEKSLVFRDDDFRSFDFDGIANLGCSDLVYCDPPYLITTAAYNESGGWTDKDERDLYTLLDNLDEQGVKFALSNVLEHKERINDILIEWSGRYNVRELSASYANANYQSTKRDSITREVLITNY